MNVLSDFISNDTLTLTLTNEQGEKHTVGAADHIRSLKSKTVLRWKHWGNYGNTFPFTYAILHGKKRIFDALTIKPILPTVETVIELVY